jgi:Domain of unknown function (DUF3883)
LVPLSDYTPLLTPADQDALRREESELGAIKAKLEASHGGRLYFPFAFSDNRPVRTTQGYLVKFPADAVELFAELDSVPHAPRPGRLQRVPPRPVGTTGRYQNDPRVRAAVERHAVTRAIDHYESQGFTVKDVGSFESFDLRMTRGTETRHVEVKGSTGPALTVELTAGEVKNATRHQPTDLYVVRGIVWWREPDGSVATDGGNAQVFSDWTPAPGDLVPTSYQYRGADLATQTSCWVRLLAGALPTRPAFAAPYASLR